MKEINVSELKDNMFDAISKEWMLVTAGTQEKFNMMTASWGGTGVLWAKPVALFSSVPSVIPTSLLKREKRLPCLSWAKSIKIYIKSVVPNLGATLIR